MEQQQLDMVVKDTCLYLLQSLNGTSTLHVTSSTPYHCLGVSLERTSSILLSAPRVRSLASLAREKKVMALEEPYWE